MSSTINGYGQLSGNSAIQSYNTIAREKEVKKTDKTSKTNDVSKLSDKAKALLKELNNKYSDTEFMVADLKNGENPQDVLSRSTKEISVILSNEELEEMASSEEKLNEYMDKIKGAVDMTDKLRDKYGLPDGNGQLPEGVSIDKIGITIDPDGTVKYFAELSKSSENQRKRLEEAREKKAEEAKEAEKAKEAKDAEKAENEGNVKGVANKEAPLVKRTYIEAATEDALFKKIADIDWNSIKYDDAKVGGKFDFTA